MRYLHLHCPSKPTVFALLMIASAVAVLLPRDLLSRLRDLTLPLAVAQMGVRKSTGLMAERVRATDGKAVSGQAHEQILRRMRARENEAAALRQQVAQLKTDNDALTGIRQLGFGTEWILVPARVASLDAAPGRHSLQLLTDPGHRVRSGDWVVTRTAENDQAAPAAGGETGALLSECLIGRIEQTSTFTSRVTLLADLVAERAMRVQIAGRDGRRIEFALQGRAGRMHIFDIAKSLIENRDVCPGDLVTSAGDDPRLPAPLVVGRIAEIKLNRDKPLYYNAVVEPRPDPKRLGEVTIVHFSGARGEAARGDPPAR